MMKYRFWLFFVLFFCSFSGVSQEKEERELKIGLNDFPNSAQTIIRERVFVKRIKFYKEIDGNKLSYEAKFKYRNYQYSLEFSETGTIEDIEIKIKEKELPESALANIEDYLDNNFDKFKLRKIQMQYLNSSFTDVINAAFEKMESDKINYEIIVEYKKDRQIGLLEVTFNSKGQFLKKRDVKRSSYEHVLY